VTILHIHWHNIMQTRIIIINSLYRPVLYRVLALSDDCHSSLPATSLLRACGQLAQWAMLTL